jgi:hypothetical protein
LALYVERGVKPRRIGYATRIALALLSRLFNWRDALVAVRPATLIHWHRTGWKLFWRMKSRPGRPPIPRELQALIRRMARESLLESSSRHRRAESYAVRAASVLGGLHHEYSLVPAGA